MISHSFESLTIKQITIKVVPKMVQNWRKIDSKLKLVKNGLNMVQS